MNKRVSIQIAVLLVLFTIQGYSQDAKLTIIMNNYKDFRAPGDTISFDVAQKGMGIRYFKWGIYPEELIGKAKANFIEYNGKFGFLVLDAFQLMGIDNDNLQKARETLQNGKPVLCATMKPVSITIIIPPGRYYIDYSFGTNINVMGSDEFAPMEYLTDQSRSEHNWGPYQIFIQPGDYAKINCTPNGGNSCPVMGDLNYFISYLVLGSRNEWQK